MSSLKDDWLRVRITAPPEVGLAVIAFLEREFGYAHLPDGIDWCVWERESDFSQVDYGPCEPITRNPYTVDWRKGQGRGDIELRQHGSEITAVVQDGGGS